jgi:hypothetical protein
MGFMPQLLSFGSFFQINANVRHLGFKSWLNFKTPPTVDWINIIEAKNLQISLKLSTCAGGH